MHATLAPPRNQLPPLENHWNSLHFQCPALMGDSARQRHPGGQPGNLTVSEKPSKTIGCSNIFTIANCRMFDTIVRAAPRKQDAPEDHAGCAAESVRKSLENVVFSVLVTTTGERSKGIGHRGKSMGKRNCSP